MANDLALRFCKEFNLDGEVLSCKTFGGGHINGTNLLKIKQKDGEHTYVAQSINTYVFKNADAMMNNIGLVTTHIRNKIIASGRDPKRLVLNFLNTKNGKYYFIDDNGIYWRGYEFVDSSVSYDSTKDPAVLNAAGKAFGEFQIQLSDFDASLLVETIANFHNTRSRFADFKEAVKNDIAGRAASVKPEIEFALSHEDIACKLVDLLNEGKLPLRVTHNDTKSNNVLFDKDTNQPIAVIDLDTVMPGLAGYDFGDSIRFAANTAVEDEKDLSKVGLDLKLFEAYAEGFIGQVSNALTELEIMTMPDGALGITLEQYVRFLGDYLNGDTYFKIDYPEHNLDRSRCQMALAMDMEKKLLEMRKIVERVYKSVKNK